MVLLSGLIFSCPISSPAVTLRVKSTVQRESTPAKKVCELKEINFHQRFTSFTNAWFRSGWVACVMWSSSLLERCHPEWMIQLSVSQQMPSVVTFSTNSKYIAATNAVASGHCGWLPCGTSYSILTGKCLRILELIFTYQLAFSLYKWTCSTRICAGGGMTASLLKSDWPPQCPLRDAEILKLKRI